MLDKGWWVGHGVGVTAAGPGWVDLVTPEIEAARAALKRREWARASGLWAAVIVAVPDLAEGWRGCITALHEQKDFAAAENLLGHACERFPADWEIAALRARNHAARGDMAAVAAWRGFIETFPDRRDGYAALCGLFEKAKNPAGLEEIAAQGLAVFPGDMGLMLHGEKAAALRRDWPLAAERCQALNQKFPGNQEILLRLSETLRSQRKFDEADRILSQARDAFPDVYDVTVKHAWVAMEREAWPEAVRRWNAAMKRFSDHATVWWGMSIALQGAKLGALRAVLLDQGVVKFPDDGNLAVDRAWTAIEAHDWASARAQLAVATARFPDSARAVCDYAYVLMRSGEADAAEAALGAALPRFADNIDVHMGFARAANARGDLAAALRRWEDLARAHPDHAQIREELGKTRYLAAAEVPAAPAVGNGSAAMSDAELVMAFESLGGNCEFGLLQRAVGAEPLGLLRFAAVRPEALLLALRNRFDGVGSAAFTNLDGGENEYYSSDSRYGFSSHCFVDPANVKREVFYASLLQKLTFLKRKLLEDLADGEKIFVFKVRHHPLPDSTLAEIAEALRAYGRPRLLVVRVAQPGKPDGTIEVFSQDVMVGYIERHGDVGSQWKIPVENWLALLRKAVSFGA